MGEGEQAVKKKRAAQCLQQAVQIYILAKQLAKLYIYIWQLTGHFTEMPD